MGVFFYFHTPADGWYREICCRFKSTMPDIQSFRPPFSKGGAVKGAEPLSPIAMGETPPNPPPFKNLESGVFFSLCLSWGEEPFLKEGFLPPTPPNSQKL